MTSYLSIRSSLPVIILAMLTCHANGKPTVLNGIKAVVNGEPITQMNVDSAVRTQLQVWLVGNKGQVTQAEADRELRKMEKTALDDLIDRKLILSEFKSKGGVIKDQYVDESVDRFIKGRFGGDEKKFRAELASTGITMAQFREVQRDQIAIQALRSQNSGRQVVPNTPWEKRAKYDEIKGEFKSEGKVKLRIMSIPKQTQTSSQTQQKATLDNVMSQLNKGADFGTLAKKHSEDSFAAKGGYVGVIGRGTLNQGLTQVAYSMKPGRFSQPLDDGPFWRILKVESRVGQTSPSFEKLEEEIDRRLTIEKRQKSMEAWLVKLRRDANVRIYED